MASVSLNLIFSIYVELQLPSSPPNNLNKERNLYSTTDLKGKTEENKQPFILQYLTDTPPGPTNKTRPHLRGYKKKITLATNAFEDVCPFLVDPSYRESK